MTTKKFTDNVALLTAIDADAYSANTYVGAYVPVEYFDSFAALFAPGDLGTSGTLNASVYQATSSTGAGAKVITGTAITALTQAGTDSNKQAWVNFKASDLDVAGGFKFVTPRMVIAVATSDAAAYLFGIKPFDGPASGHDVSSVDEIVTV